MAEGGEFNMLEDIPQELWDQMMIKAKKINSTLYLHYLEKEPHIRLSFPF
jgi:hypothetical protein